MPVEVEREMTGLRWVLRCGAPVADPVQGRRDGEGDQEGRRDRPHDRRRRPDTGELQRQRCGRDGDDPVPMIDANQFGVRFDTIRPGRSNSRNNADRAHHARTSRVRGRGERTCTQRARVPRGSGTANSLAGHNGCLWHCGG